MESLAASFCYVAEARCVTSVVCRNSVSVAFDRFLFLKDLPSLWKILLKDRTQGRRLANLCFCCFVDRTRTRPASPWNY